MGLASQGVVLIDFEDSNIVMQVIGEVACKETKGFGSKIEALDERG